MVDEPERHMGAFLGLIRRLPRTCSAEILSGGGDGLLPPLEPGGVDIWVGDWRSDEVVQTETV